MVSQGPFLLKTGWADDGLARWYLDFMRFQMRDRIFQEERAMSVRYRTQRHGLIVFSSPNLAPHIGVMRLPRSSDRMASAQPVRDPLRMR